MPVGAPIAPRRRRVAATLLLAGWLRPAAAAIVLPPRAAAPEPSAPDADAPPARSIVIPEPSADDGGAPTSRFSEVTEAFGDDVGAVVVESHPVAERLAFGNTPQPWLLVTGLGFGGNRADFGETESKTNGSQNCRGALVLARRHANASGNGARKKTSKTSPPRA